MHAMRAGRKDRKEVQLYRTHADAKPRRPSLRAPATQRKLIAGVSECSPILEPAGVCGPVSFADWFHDVSCTDAGFEP